MKEAVLWHLALWSTVIGAKLAGISLDKHGWACVIILYMIVLFIAISREAKLEAARIELEKEKIASEERKLQASLEFEKYRATNEFTLGKMVAEQPDDDDERQEKDLHVVGFQNILDGVYPENEIIPPDATP